jgi:hypothetical protein
MQIAAECLALAFCIDNCRAPKPALKRQITINPYFQHFDFVVDDALRNGVGPEIQNGSGT